MCLLYDALNSSRQYKYWMSEIENDRKRCKMIRKMNDLRQREINLKCHVSHHFKSQFHALQILIRSIKLQCAEIDYQ